MDSFKRGFAAIAAGLIVLGGAAGFAHASPGAEPRSITLRYSDLDFAKPESAQILYRRIRSAAAQVCGQGGARDARRYMQWRSCFDDTVARAVEQVDRPAVTALHRTKTGRTPA